MADDAQNPEDVVDEASIDLGDEGDGSDEAEGQEPGRKKKAPAVERPYPRKTMEEALRVPRTIRENNGGQPWSPSEVAKALGVGAQGGNFFYLTAASRHFGFTEGARDAQVISLTDLGRQAVMPTSPEAEAEAKLTAFYSVDLFKKVVEHYGGANLPKDEFVRNTLESNFGLDPRVHDEFLELFKKNARYVGIGAEATVPASGQITLDTGDEDDTTVTPAIGLATPTVTRASGDQPVCFVIMPFGERTDDYATGFFDEVFASLFKPAIEAAGFDARTARRQGSDVIHSTIVTELMDADLVLADLTEHNPNVLFELGVRMTLEKPTALVRAKGTGPIFDVDNLLRVESYNPNLWPSTVEKDVPKLKAHLEAAWEGRNTDVSFMKLLRGGR